MGFILPDDIDQYIERHTTPQDELLSELDRETHLHHILPQMLAGTVQGRFLEMITRMLRPKRILEIGTFTGYSAICMARGLAPGGKLITIDVNKELEPTVRSFFSRSGMEDRIDFRLGDATRIIPELDEVFDLVFIDADKGNYGNYFDLVMPMVRLDGYIMADNVLWSGKVVEEPQDSDTKALVEYSDKVHNDGRVENVLLSVRDGIMIARKIVE